MNNKNIKNIFLIIITSLLFIEIYYNPNEIISYYIDNKISYLFLFLIFIISYKSWHKEKKTEMKISNDTKKPKHTIILLIIILLSLFFKIIIQEKSIGINMENDLVYYDAKLLLAGEEPYKDFVAREPYTLYLTSFFLNFLKNYDLLLFNFYIIFYIGTILCVYILAREMFDKKCSIISTSIFAFSPFFLKFSSANYIFYINIYLFFLTITSIFFLKSIKKDKKRYFFLSGLFLGITTFIYRASLPYILTFPILNIILSENDKKVLKNNLIFIIGLTISILPPIIYHSQKTSFYWLSKILLADKIILALILIIPVSIIFIYYKKYLMQNKYVSTLIFSIITIILLISFIKIDQTTVLEKIGVINDYVRHIGYFILPSISIIIFYTIESFFPKIILKKYLLFLINFLAILIIFLGLEHPTRGTSFELSRYFVLFYTILLLIFTVINPLFLKNIQNITKEMKIPISIFAILSVSQLCANILFTDWLENYVVNYFLFCFYISIFWLYLISRKNLKKFKYLTICFMSLLCISTCLFYYKYNYNENSEITKTSFNETINFITENTKEKEEIFTAIPSFVLRSNRELALNITHPVIYASQNIEYTEENFSKAIPSIETMINYLEKNKVEYIIADKRTKSLFISNRHENLKNYILQNYEVSKIIDNIEIYKRSTKK